MTRSVGNWSDVFAEELEAVGALLPRVQISGEAHLSFSSRVIATAISISVYGVAGGLGVSRC
jgi:hypothetical protein